jgi:hypothetical protein
VDEKFAKAINELSYYESVFHPSRPDIVARRMEAAKLKDKTFSTILNTLKEKSGKGVRAATRDTFPRTDTDSQPTLEPMKVVYFLICKTLPDDNPEPTVVQREHQLAEFRIPVPDSCARGAQ